jgi:cholesterol transport system auxiliary component
MTAAPHPSTLPRLVALAALLWWSALLGGCSALRPSDTQAAAFYALEAPQAAAPPAPPPGEVPPAPYRALPAVILTSPRAAAGFDSQRIIFVRNDHQLEYFAHSEWVDTPARMLGPLLAAALEKTGVFGAVVLTPTSASADWRLDTEIIRLQHDFRTTPSRVQFTLRAYLLDERARSVIAWREFHGEAVSGTESPKGGVAAANQAVQSVLKQLAEFLVQVKG